MRNNVPVLDIEPGEMGLLLVFWISSGYMFIDSYSYTGWDGVFPRLFSLLVFVCTSMLIFREFLPKPLKVVVAGESIDLSSIGEQSQDDGSDEEEVSHDPEGLNEQAGVLLALTLGYVALSYLFGMLWATPFFVLAYVRWAGYSWLHSALLALLMFGVTYGMFVVFNFPIEMGWVHEMLGM